MKAELGIFPSPKVYIEADFEIFPSPRDYMKESSSEFFQVPEPRVKLEIFLSPRAYIEGMRSEFIEVPETIYEGRDSFTFPIYFFMFFTYSCIFLHGVM